jgi:uncharacterized protein YceK
MRVVLDRRMALVLALLTGGCATVSVRTDSDPTVDFNRYRTVQVLGGRLLRCSSRSITAWYCECLPGV